MTLKNLLLVIPILIVKLSYTQNLVTVQGSSGVSFYTSINSAVSSASNGDTIYIPGGSWSITPSLTINKKLHIFGVGHNPDSTIATGYTLLTGDINILSNASGGSISGLKCAGTIRFGTTAGNQDVNNYEISRCNLTNLYLGFSSPTTAELNLFYENLVTNGVVDLYNSVNNGFYNNVFYIVKNVGINNLFRNNIFNLSMAENYSDGYFWYGCQASFVNAKGSLFENNIFRGKLMSAGGYNDNFSNCTFYNNLFSMEGDCGSAAPTCTGCVDYNSLLSQPDSLIFEYYPIGQVFQYDLNFQLQESSQGKNAGTDGSDIGVYGGTYAWKESGTPKTPHIQTKAIGAASNADGTLDVEIKVKAQNE
jgi:hypothetical protein